jgi:enoyl-CoA hydratase/carnithine racemase
MEYEHIVVERPADGVGLVRLTAPNVQCIDWPMMDEPMSAGSMNTDDRSGVCGSRTDKVFQAGADISEMAQATG